MNDIINAVMDKMPIGVMLYNQQMENVYCNKRAISVLKRYELPHEIADISKRIFEAIQSSRLNELFPGEIYLSKKLEDSPSNWTFKFFVSENPQPLVGVFIIEEAVSNKVDLNQIRQQFKLTRREVDVLRRVLDGLKNIEIAEDLEISEQTVKDHMSNVYMKIGVENRFSLIRSLISTSEIHHH